MSLRTGRLAIAALLAFYVAAGAWFLARNAQTYDEPAYYYSGYAYLATGDTSVNVHQPPLSKALVALPAYTLARLGLIAPPAFAPIGGALDDPVMSLLYGSPLPFTTMLTLGRLPMLLCGLLTILLVGRWAWHLWGMSAAVLATALLATDPTFVAHSCLATPDVVVTLCYTLCFYLVWRQHDAPAPARVIGAGIALGAAIGTKFSALAALPALGVLVLAEWGLAGGRPRLRSLITAGAVLTLWLTLAAATLTYLYGIAELPILQKGINGQLLHVAQGHPAYLWGRYSEQGWWYYFPAAYALKTPLPTLTAILASVVFPFVGGRFDRRALLALAVPGGAILASTIWGGVDIGVRYLLPVYPFLCVAGARIATFGGRWSQVMRLAIPAGVAANVVGLLMVAPHLIASANVLAGGPAGLARVLSDSNIDWGQDIGNLQRYLERAGIPAVYLAYFGTARPSDFGIRSQPLPSNYGTNERQTFPADAKPILAISVTHLQGVYLTNRELYAWLREREPIARIGWSIYVYDLSDEPRLHCRLAELYAAANAGFYATHERNLCDRS